MSVPAIATPPPMGMTANVGGIHERSLFDPSYGNSGQGVLGPDGTFYKAVAALQSGLVPIDSSILSALWQMKTASRVSFARHGHLRAAVLTFRREVIGSGLVLRSLHPDRGVRDALQMLWKEWGETPDVSGVHTWRSLLHLVVNSIIIDGEAVVCEHMMNGALRLEMIDSVRLDMGKNDWREGVYLGVEKDELMRPTAYWIMDRPKDGGYGTAGYSGERRTYPASQIMHIYDHSLPEQSRGVPWGFASLRRFDELREYDEAERNAAVLGSKIYAVQTSGNESIGEVGNQPGVGLLPASGRGDKRKGAAQGQMQVESGKVINMPYGHKLDFTTPQHPNTAYPDFVSAQQMAAAASMGLAAMSMTGDMSNANFVQSRMARIMERGTILLVRNLVVERMCKRVFQRWLMTVAAREFPRIPLAELERVEFVGERFQHVQPKEAANADHQRLEDGLVSPQELIREEGRDYETVMAEIKEHREAMQPTMPQPVEEDDGMEASEGAKMMGTIEGRNRLRELHAVGATKTELAKIAGVSRQAVSKMLDGFSHKTDVKEAA